MKVLKKLMLLVFFIGVCSLNAEMTKAEGLPLPWPFPWAKECPVNWDGMAGKYALTDGSTSGKIQMRISIIVKRNFRYIRVSRYGAHGELLYDGTTSLKDDWRVISLYLMPTDEYVEPVYATIKLHYPSWVMDCTADRLVPILSIRPVDSQSEQIDYRLVKVQ